MVPDHVKRAALLGLLHDLPAVVHRYAPNVRGLGGVLALALPATPAEQALVERASAYAAAGGRSNPLVSAPLRAVLAQLQPVEAREAWAALGKQPVALARNEAPDEAARAAFVAAMCDTLAGLAAQIELDDFAQSYPALLAWVEQLGRGLPAHRDDLPLAAHARLASAAAACMAQQPSALCLVGMALVGERDYCLGAAGNFGRLFARAGFVAALREALAHSLAERLQLPFGNMLAHDGERSLLLAPAGAGTRATLAELELETNLWLHEAFAGELAVALAYTPLGESETAFGAGVSALGAALDVVVQQPGRAALTDAGGWREDAFVLRAQRFAAHAPCAGCGRLPGSEPGGLCPHCARDERLFPALASAAALAFYRVATTGSIELIPGWHLLPVAEGVAPDAPALLVPLGQALPATQQEAPGRLPTSDTGAPLGLADIAARAQGHARLGYVQIQIEPLRALQHESPTSWNAAYTVALSHELALLRTRWLRQLLEQPRYRAFAAIALGASTLLVGPWDQAAALALDFRTMVGRASNGARPACAAGVLVAKTGYPLARAIADADSMLARAQLDAAGFGDRITLLGDTVGWGDAPTIFAEVARLQPHGHAIGAALLRDLAAYGRLQRLWREAGRTEGLRYKALFTYSLARALRRGDAELYRWADEIMRSLHGPGDGVALRHIGVIATYLLLTRHDD